jgi:hypothetical protein
MKEAKGVAALEKAEQLYLSQITKVNNPSDAMLEHVP